jgi:hypothetical protein
MEYLVTLLALLLGVVIFLLYLALNELMNISSQLSGFAYYFKGATWNKITEK